MLKLHSLVNRKIKKNISSKDYEELEKFMAMYNDRYIKRLVYLAQRPKRLFGHNGAKYLLCSLHRSKALFTGLMDCINKSNLALAFLSVRAHYETTGSVAYFFSYLQKFYKNEITYIEMDKVLRKLSIGGRDFPLEKKTDPDWEDAFNVLTLIDEADKLFNEMVGEKKDVFRDNYGFLSEFCHPNLLGLTIHSEIDNSQFPPRVIFHETYVFTKSDINTLLSHLNISCHFFFPIYDKCFSIIKAKEEMPDLYKH